MTESNQAKKTYDESIQEEERERIISLLEKKRCNCSSMVCIPICRHILTIDEIIALIKEDNNG